VDQHTRENWHKIKQVLEDAGKTDSYLYKRAVAICRGGKDPFEDGTASTPQH
jgi:hypothetical protein